MRNAKYPLAITIKQITFKLIELATVGITHEGKFSSNPKESTKSLIESTVVLTEPTADLSDSKASPDSFGNIFDDENDVDNGNNDSVDDDDDDDAVDDDDNDDDDDDAVDDDDDAVDNDVDVDVDVEDRQDTTGHEGGQGQITNC